MIERKWKYKKSILPAAIIILSIFVLNTFIDTGEKEERLEAAASEAPEVRSGMKRVKSIFLAKGERTITKKMVENAAKKARVLELEPYQGGRIQLADNQTRMVLGEWDSKAGKEIQEPDWYQIEGTVNRLDTRIFLIHVETDGGKATYLTKVKVKKWHSFQDLLNPNIDGYTLIVFSSEATGIGNLAINSEKYHSHEVKGTLPEIQEKYPELEIRNLPTAFIFHEMRCIFKSEDISELRTLITDVKTFEFVGENENWHVELEGKQTLSRRDAEFFITYRGNEEITGDIDITLNGDNWGWGPGAVMPLSDTLTISGETPVFLSKSDNLSVVLRWDGKEEEIALEYKGER